MTSLRRYLIAGLLVWVPIGITFFVIKIIVDFLDRVVYLLPRSYQPEQLLGYNIPGVGLIITVLLVFFTGMIATNYIGHHLLGFWEQLLSRIPLVRSIHSSVKQVLHTIFSADGQSFRRVLLVRFPRQENSWSIAFQTSSGFKQAEHHTNKDLVTVFVPTTPNPTSGFLMFIPRDEVIALDISIDEALRLVISLGVVLPPGEAGQGATSEEITTPPPKSSE